MIHCPLCGYDYDPAASKPTCQGCPLHQACSTACCPRCGYKMPAESKLGKLFKRLAAKGEQRADTHAAAKR
jgi:hypothetical protein